MNHEDQVQVIRCFQIKGRGIIAFLQHQLTGLPSGTILTSTRQEKMWKVESRILNGNLGKLHHKFENETINFDFPLIRDPESAEINIQRTRDEEQQGIFMYRLSPVSHREKPNEGEWLLVQFC